MRGARKGEDGGSVCGPMERSIGAAQPRLRPSFRDLALALAAALLGASLLGAGTAQAQTPGGTAIDNVATAVYRDPSGTPVSTDSNLDRVLVSVSRTPSTIEFLKLETGFPSAVPTAIGPQLCSQTGNASGSFVPSPPMTDFSGNPIDLGSLVPLVADGAYHAGEPVFLRVDDADQNLDQALVETVDVVLTTTGGDRETLRLSENGPNTGIFLGYIMSATPPPVPGDCRISVGVGDSIRVDYVDVADGSDASSDATLVDPFGIVFDGATGTPVDGAQITLWDVLAGAPANPVGDDGVSSFPATILSGGSVTDGSGRVYDFDSGRFRFPFVQPGLYELRVVPPATHVHPSTASTGQIQGLPGAPYAIVPGSRGEPFVVPIGPAIQIDIPLDPLGAGLLVTKQAGKERVGAGEFVPYRLRVTNASNTTLIGAQLFDRLPPRFRYEKDSARISEGPGIDPVLGEGGSELVFDLGDLAPNAALEIQYVVRVAPGAKPGDQVNRAFVQTSGGLRSNVAEATVTIEPDLFDDRAYLVGRIHVDACGLEPDAPAEGLAGVKVYLEDGTFVVTDEEGRYHFEAISAGTHVVQLDLESIPEAFEPDDCESSQRRAGRSFSEFVEVQPGTLWRSDFHVRRRVPKEGALAQTFSAQIETEGQAEGEAEGAQARVEYALELSADRLDATQIVAMIHLPEALRFEVGSATIDGKAIEATEESGTVVLRIDRILASESRMLRLRARTTSEAASGPIETTALVRARPENGSPVSTPPAVLRFPLTVEPTNPGPLPAAPAPDPENAAPASRILRHRLLHRTEGSIERYALQILVEDELPEVILAEVAFPPHEQMVGWSPRNEANTPVTTLREGNTSRFILPRDASRRAVRVFLMNGQPQKVLQIFFAANRTGMSDTKAVSRILPSPSAAPIERVRRSPIAVGEVPGAATGQGRDEAVSGSTTRAASQVVFESRPADAADETGKSKGPEPTSLQNLQTALDRIDEAHGAEWLEKAEAGRRFVYPVEGELPRIPSLKLGVQHEPELKVELLRNGERISAVHFDGRSQSADRSKALSRWRGLGIQEGENVFVAIFRDAEGAEVERIERRVHLAGAPVRAELVPEASTLVADGRTPPVIALRLFDRFGKPVREGSTGQFDLDPPYQTEQRVVAARTAPLQALGFDRPSFVVDADGLARIRLHPTSIVGDARLRFPFRTGRDHEVRAWLEPGDRDWVLVGLATGTAGWNTVSEGARGRESRRSEDVEEDVITEGRVALFAKGRVPGSFLLTTAYDSDAGETRLPNRLFQVLEPDETYTLYGDATQRDFDAPTSGPLYVKIERKRFYALYGDYQTGLEETELSRYARTLTGAKLEYQGEIAEAKGFVTDSDQSFVRDEILGDGTSGLYRLSRKDIVPGSEKILIEVRDRFRPELVLSSEPQSRFVDYDIDYRDGTLFFKRPIPGQDENFDPIFIVVDYETNDRRKNAVTGGGRVAAKAFDERAELGFTAIHESADQLDSQLYGGDMTVDLGEATELNAEYAHTQGDGFDEDRKADAWLVAVDHRGDRLDLRAYAREQEEEFGLGQQRGTVASLRTYGVDGGFDWFPRLRTETSLFRQENLSTDALRDVAELRTRWERGTWGLNGGVRYAGSDSEVGVDHGVQLLAGARSDVFDGRVTLRTEGEAAIVEDRYGDFPYRAIAGADWHLHPKLSLFVDQELGFGEQQRSADTRAGVRGAPWKGASVTTSVNQESREYGPRTYANLGLQQRFDLSPTWGFDIALDRTATIRDPGNPAFRVGVPAASGSFTDDYTALSLGTAYRTTGFSSTGRFEARFGENEDRFGVLAGLLRDANEDLSWSARIDLFHSDMASGAEELRTDSSLSLAYRPLRSHWIVLDRLDFEYRDNSGGDFDFESRKLLHHLKLNQIFDRRTQIAWQLSNKLVVDSLDERSYSNFGTLVGAEMRRDFAPGWDMSMHGRARHQTGGDEVSAGYGLSIGRILVQNVWLSLGYNLVGFYDPEFSSSEYTAQGPYFRIRAKFDQLSVREALKHFR
jgi:uncharacterized repeat protein (TIGR01451 family)